MEKTDKEIRLNIGCGFDFKEGWDNIDRWQYDPRVIPLELEDAKFPYPDNSVVEIKAFHVLEHINSYPALLNECWRVLKPSGFIHIAVPCFPHDDSVKDPTHVRYFVPETFYYFSVYQEQGRFQMYRFKSWHIENLGLTHDRSTIEVKMTPNK